ncbi:MAG: tRNA (N6-threonylcarbamoyladenosine(37)-N6)-methyltransferase TrmO [Deltaproteobacteria bacterium]|nr:tRNA (N6-threonylcarbamoyladenosine(37)-N6)-methyltransferase TrmO [Deltaproteobacteria bacterium]
MSIEMNPIGYVSTDVKKIPRSWKVSDVEGSLKIDEAYLEGLREIKPGQRIYVIFHFHKSPPFSEKFMRIKPPSYDRKVGVFSSHSPFRPNPIGMSLLEVLDVEAATIRVKGLDMMDGTPILDIKPDADPWEG